MTMCATCILEEGTPGIYAHQPPVSLSFFDGKWLCPECLELYQNPLDKAQLMEQWLEFVRSLNKDGEHYDVLFAYSGGKDSTAALHLIVREYSIKPLAFTVDHGLKGTLPMENALRVTQALKVDWLMIHEDTRKTFYQWIANYESPCGRKCRDAWKNKTFRKVVEQYGLDQLITGGDIPVGRKVVLPGDEEWKVRAIAMPVAAHCLTEEQIIRLAEDLGWQHPQFAGWDTDCMVAGVAVERYRKRYNCYLPMEVHHLASKVRYGVMPREETLYALAHPPKVSEQVWHDIGLSPD